MEDSEKLRTFTISHTEDSDMKFYLNEFSTFSK